MINQLKAWAKENYGIELIHAEIIRQHEKLLASCVTTEGARYFIKGETMPLTAVEKSCFFANALHSVLPTSPYIRTKDNEYSTRFEQYICTMEKQLEGEEISVLTDAHIGQMGLALGKMHDFSLKNNYRLDSATSWAMFGGNATDALGHYDENELSFKTFQQAFQQLPQFAPIELLYTAHRTRLKQFWPLLPTAATQGDFCYYNMLFQDGQLSALYDFNLAGDEILVNECVAVGIYTCWHVAYCGSLSEQQRFEHFIEAYKSVRPWTSQEEAVYPALFAIIRAFRFDRVDNGITNIAQHAEFMCETLNILEQGK